jgi:hypothetical protein
MNKEGRVLRNSKIDNNLKQIFFVTNIIKLLFYQSCKETRSNCKADFSRFRQQDINFSLKSFISGSLLCMYLFRRSWISKRLQLVILNWCNPFCEDRNNVWQEGGQKEENFRVTAEFTWITWRLLVNSKKLADQRTCKTAGPGGYEYEYRY